MATVDERMGRKRLGVLVEEHAWGLGYRSQEGQADFYGIRRDVYRQIVKNTGSHRISNATVDKLVDKGLDRTRLLALRNGLLDGDPDGDITDFVNHLRAMKPERRQAFYHMARVLAVS